MVNQLIRPANLPFAYGGQITKDNTYLLPAGFVHGWRWIITKSHVELGLSMQNSLK